MTSVFVIGNWKMNGSADLAATFSNKIESIRSELSEQVTVALCVPDLLISAFEQEGKIRVGAQNLSEFTSGAYTGETSAQLLTEQGCDLVIVGHSERRQLFAETSEQVAKKAAKALEFGLTPIVCLGETGDERKNDQTFDVIGEQLQAVQKELGDQNMEKIWLAYEPVWAIGTGLTASPDQAQEVHAWLRNRLGKVGQSLPILYGGSVNAANANNLFAQQDIDGGLIGGASLKVDEFENICRAANTLINNKG